MNRLTRIAGILLLASLAGCYRAEEETATKGHLSLYVSESLQPLLQKEAEEFCSIYPDAHVAVLGAQTREAIVHLLNDSVPMIISDRTLNAEEQDVVNKNKMDLQRIRIAEDALAVLVNPRNTIETISQETLKEILTRKTDRWKKLPESEMTGPIDLALTGRNSGAYEWLAKYFGITDDFSPAAVFPTQKEVVHFIQTHPRAIGLVSLACYKNPSVFLPAAAKDSSLPVRALAFSGMDSTGQKTVFKLHQANVYMGRYPLHFSVFIYFNIGKSALGSGFCSFLTSGRGQQIILNWGLVPVTQPIRLIQLSEEKS